MLQKWETPHNLCEEVLTYCTSAALKAAEVGSLNEMSFNGSDWRGAATTISKLTPLVLHMRARYFYNDQPPSASPLDCEGKSLRNEFGVGAPRHKAQRLQGRQTDSGTSDPQFVEGSVRPVQRCVLAVFVLAKVAATTKGNVGICRGLPLQEPRTLHGWDWRIRQVLRRPPVLRCGAQARIQATCRGRRVL